MLSFFYEPSGWLNFEITPTGKAIINAVPKKWPGI